MSPPAGLRLAPGRLDPAAQGSLLADIDAVIADAPLFVPRMPRTGVPMRVRMTNCGPLGWVTDQALGYRYQPTHPDTGRPWPPIPAQLRALWDEFTAYPAPPQACLVNLYRDDARMGLHVDADEDAKDAPVLSISLGDTALFRIGGARRSDPTASIRLASGDVLALAGAARRAWGCPPWWY
jgi:alkylated DNA repair protein (DNA oxidative demethylase)